jgi:Uri superfamily endonuclease
MDELPAQPGSYALILELTGPQVLQVRRLGRFNFLAGIYVYLGSACGPGGIRARVGRHLCGGGQPHWHIDYLRPEADFRGYGYIVETGDCHVAHTPKECNWSQKLAALPGASIPVPRFGASDCRSGCPAHLVYCQDLQIDEVLAAVKSLNPDIKTSA